MVRCRCSKILTMSEPGKDKSANSGLSRPAQPQATWPMTPGM